MTQPVPEETNEAYDLDAPPPGEHESEAPGPDDGAPAAGATDVQEENAETSLDQPSQ